MPDGTAHVSPCVGVVAIAPQRLPLQLEHQLVQASVSPVVSPQRVAVADSELKEERHHGTHTDECANDGQGRGWPSGGTPQQQQHAGEERSELLLNG